MPERALRLDLGAGVSVQSGRQGGSAPGSSPRVLNLSAKTSEEAFHLILYLSNARAASKLKIQIML